MQRLGCILAAWVLWSAVGVAQAPDDTEHLAERDWQIPITLAEPIRKEATLLTLYVSTDLGKTWKKEATAKPNDESFKYVASSDGAFWFSVSFVNRSGQTVPAKETDLQPQLKIVVDTKRPEVKVQVLERQGNQVTVSWDAKDEHLDLGTLQLQYKPRDASAWRAIALSPGTSSGKKQFDVGTAGQVAVRVSLKDRAGNLGEEQVDVPASQIVTSNQVPPGQAGGAPNLTLPPAPAANAPALSTSTNPTVNPNGQLPRVDGTLPAPLPTNPPLLSNAPSTTSPSATNVPAANLPPQSNNPSRPAGEGFKPASASTHWNNLPNPGNTNTSGSSGYTGRTRTQPGPILWSNSLHLDLDFDLKAGPSGIGVVELWYTLDGGKTWQLMDKREEIRPPFGIDVQGEGIFGFTMVAKNKVGLGRPAPAPGEAPELRVGVDVTAPHCELIMPVEAVPGRKDVVNIKWSAIDNNLSGTPIKIEWAETANGPWQSVVDRSANTGNFLWRVPANIPPQVYFKMDVTDMAGNVGTYITREAVIVDMQEPEVRLKALVQPKK